MLNIVSKSKYSYFFSGILVAFSVAALFFWGLKFGIDFNGGTLLEVEFSQGLPATEELEGALGELNLQSLTFQPTQSNTMLIRYAPENDLVNGEAGAKILEKYPEASILRVDYINSAISHEFKRNSLLAIFWAVVAIMTYIAIVFRKVSIPVASWKYGLGAVIALVHDILITIGVFSVLGHFWGVEVGIPFVAALLTILGFSVHDTIVVYDRTRENLQRSSSKEKFPDVVNRSLNETLVRSINTSLTVVITLLAIFFFGGDSVKYFSLALLIGVVFGTYSSIFVASALLVTSYNLQSKRS